MKKISEITKNLQEPERQQRSLPSKLQKRAEALLQVCSTPAGLIVRFNYDFCRKRYKFLDTQELALKSNLIKLSELIDVYSEDTPVDLLRAWLLNMSIYLGLDVDGQVIKEIARELYEEIFMLNIAELTLLFSRIKRGYYGSFYGRFDGITIISAAREFRSARGFIISRLP
jgi:hypothetical protein